MPQWQANHGQRTIDRTSSVESTSLVSTSAWARATHGIAVQAIRVSNGEHIRLVELGTSKVVAAVATNVIG